LRSITASRAPRSIDDEAVERLIALTLEEAPANASQWSSRSMTRRTGMSQSAVSRIWRAFGLRPHQADTFKLSEPLWVSRRLQLLRGWSHDEAQHTLFA
jgi:DNA-binding MurR/RpiR family transcriptional regulator